MSGRFVVTGAAVVLALKSGGERYLYRSNAEISAEGYTEKTLRHAESVGLVRLVADEEPAGDKGEELAGDKGEELKKPDGRAGLEKLLEYATAKGIEVPEGADKDAVRALIDAHTEA